VIGERLYQPKEREARGLSKCLPDHEAGEAECQQKAEEGSSNAILPTGCHDLNLPSFESSDDDAWAEMTSFRDRLCQFSALY